MSKPKVYEMQYAKLVHEKMQEHEMYKQGMGVKLNPEGSEKPLGFTVIGDNDARTIMSWAEHEVQKEYELVVTL
ncbi:MAG: hypothetical protein GXP09_02650 [Gammaproteobacteria bacterium]|nr:hypothetical protein [Gammaproteobacteria bacterium]